MPRRRGPARTNSLTEEFGTLSVPDAAHCHFKSQRKKHVYTSVGRFWRMPEAWDGALCVVKKLSRGKTVGVAMGVWLLPGFFTVHLFHRSKNKHTPEPLIFMASGV